MSASEEATARKKIRARHGIGEDAVVFAVFGGLSPEKRIPQVIDAFRVTLAYAPAARLLLGGEIPRHANFSAADFADIADRVTLTGYVADEELTDYVASVDVSLNLRWPTARETSGPWLRALAAGKPTIVMDLLQLGDVATLDPRTWQLNAPDIGQRDAVAIALDIVDEDHSLRLAMRRLATDAGLRARLGRAGQEYWQREHTIAAMADDYESAFARVASVGASPSLAAAASAGRPAPPHFAPAGDEKLQALLAPFGIDSPLCTSN